MIVSERALIPLGTSHSLLSFFIFIIFSSFLSIINSFFLSIILSFFHSFVLSSDFIERKEKHLLFSSLSSHLFISILRYIICNSDFTCMTEVISCTSIMVCSKYRLTNKVAIKKSGSVKCFKSIEIDAR